MKKYLPILLIFFITLMGTSCATSKQYQTNKQKQGLMLQDNTNMRINKKYYSKHNTKTKRKSAKQSKRRTYRR